MAQPRNQFPLPLQDQGIGHVHNDPAKALMKLYAHKKDALKDLEACRINPDLTSQFRTDMEFYIPEVCSF